MEGLQTPIPRRLFYIRVLVTVALILSFFLSLNLWGGERLFPGNPLLILNIQPPYDYALAGLSILFLVCSLFLNKYRLFIFLSICVNVVLALMDLNRLQVWFYVYNAILFVLVFYNGRVDDLNKFTFFFVTLQVILASVYICNAIGQFDTGFVQGDFREVISPLSSISSPRQFDFFLSVGKTVPYLVLFTGIGLLMRPVRFLAISLAWAFHFALLILLFPSAKNTNYALWLMNLVFGLLVLLLYSGKTQTRYFNWLLLFQRPVFYVIFFAFVIVPVLNYSGYWPQSPTTNLNYGDARPKQLEIGNSTFQQLPPYVKHFCSKNNNNYFLRVGDWCRHELNSEYSGYNGFNTILVQDVIQITSNDVKETEDALSAL